MSNVSYAFGFAILVNTIRYHGCVGWVGGGGGRRSGGEGVKYVDNYGTAIFIFLFFSNYNFLVLLKHHGS